MVVLCDGMVRSGSTWSFNVALQLIRSSYPNQRTFGLYSESPRVLAAAARPRDSNLIIKSHILDSSAHGLLRAGAIKAIYTWRHPYDAIVSSMHMFGYSVDHWVEVFRRTLGIWKFHEATGTGCIIAYDSIIETPALCVEKVAAYLKLNIDFQQARQIAAAMSLERVKHLSQGVERLEGSRLVRQGGHIYDRETLLHQNHSPNGRSGYGFESLNSSQISLIDAMLKEEGLAFLCGSYR